MGALAGGGTEAEEPDAESEWMNEADEDEEESFPEEGTGAKKVMLIDGLHSEENRVAIVAEGNLDYYEVENQRRKAFKGNIYKAKVVNIAHAIEAAFVEFGGGRHGFMPLNEYCAGALMEHLGTWNEGDKRPPLRPGMEILVQVTKEESAIKGAAVTSYISIAGRYMVMMLGMKRYGISKKITGEKERERIRKQMEKLEYPDHLGFIVRTVGAARPLKDLKADLTNLLKLWDRTVDGARANKAPALLYEEQDIVIRTLRDNYSADVTEVLMNSEAAYRKASAFFDVYYPKEKGKLKLYRNKRPLFGKFNLEEQVERGTQRKVPLPSGGHIVIDRSEALWAIDVNSGRSSKDRDIEDTAFRTNGEAAAEVTRQLRLRDIGGLIVIDFIDMESKSHNKEVERILKEGLKRDKAKSDVTSLGKFGLVAISRQRMGTSFYDILLKGCDLCGGTGVIPTQDAATVRLLRRLHDELSKEGREAGKEVTVRVAPGLLETLLNQKREDINRLEKLCGGKVAFHADPALSASSFSIDNGRRSSVRNPDERSTGRGVPAHRAAVFPRGPVLPRPRASPGRRDALVRERQLPVSPRPHAAGGDGALRRLRRGVLVDRRTVGRGTAARRHPGPGQRSSSGSPTSVFPACWRVRCCRSGWGWTGSASSSGSSKRPRASSSPCSSPVP